VPDPSQPALPARLNPRGTALRRRDTRTPWRRLLTRVFMGIGVLVLLLAAGGYALYRHYNGQITRVSIHFGGPQPTASTAARASAAAASGGGAQNILLMGSDSRAFAGGQAYNVAPGSAAYVTGQRSDVVILLHIPSGAAKATLVSFPRDSWVTIPAYTDTKGITHPAVQAKLNAAYALGGAPLLVATIENLTGLHIDHFASVNFPGFQAMVDAVGGLDVCVATTRHDTNSGDFLTAGEHHINGTQALALVRDRESFPNQDLGRIKDQEYFLATMMHKVLSAGTLTNPFALNDFLNAATKSLTVDTGLSLSDMRKLAGRFAHLSTADLQFATAPVRSANYAVTSSVYGGQIQSAVELDPTQSAALYGSLASSAAPAASATASTASSAASDVALDSITVDIENATTIPGLAHKAAADLTTLGVHVANVGNAPPGAPATTTIRYPAGQQAAADTLQQHIPGSQTASDDTLTTMIVTLGTNYTGVTGAGVNPRTPPPTTTATSPALTSANNMSCAP
jgi:LCP family protein required for cell wall assembly